MKVLASDFDGTLWKDETISKEDLQAIQKFREAGNLFGICTGRPLAGILAPTKGILEFDFFILNTGALLVDKDQKIIFNHTIPIEIAIEICDLIPKEVHIASFFDGIRYCINADFHPIPSTIISKEVTSFRELDTITLDGFSAGFNSEQEALEITNMINEKYSTYCMAHQNLNFVDVVAAGCSKATGIHSLQEKYQVADDEIFVIGDSYNDIPMLEAVENSFTFPHVPTIVKQESKYVVNSVAECIETILKL